MADPEVLRDQARRLRAAARAMREKGYALDDEVRQIRHRYPLPSLDLWQGPNATTYDGHLDRAKAELAQLGREVDRYADDCEETARRKDAEADDLERAQTG